MSNNAAFAARVLAVLEGDGMPITCTCSQCGRTRPHKAKGLCRTCYEHQQFAGICGRCGKDRQRLRAGLCNTCYQAEYRASHAAEGAGHGWTVADIALALGEDRATVRAWITARALLPYADGTVADQSLHNFLWVHSTAWAWARVDPDHRAWVHSLLTDPDVRLGASKAARRARQAAERARGVAA